MSLFLGMFLLSSTLVKKAKPTDQLEAFGKDKSKKRTKPDFQLSEAMVYSQVLILKLISGSLDVNIAQLWEGKEVDSELLKKFAEVSVRVLESTLFKEKEVMGLLFELLSLLLRIRPQAIRNLQIVLSNIVYQSQNCDNLVNFFSSVDTPELQKLSSDTIVVVVSFLLQKTNINTESSSYRNTRQFLSKLSELIPKVFYNNLACFIRLYEHESYYMRNAASDILGNILKFFLKNQQELNKQRDRFVATILQRIYDKSAFCRSHILAVMISLVQAKALPRKFLIHFLKAGTDRAKDLTINTRKKALQLINAVIDEVCTSEIREVATVEKDLQVTQLQLKALKEEIDLTKTAIDAVNEEEALEKAMTDLRLLERKKQLAENKELTLMEQKEVYSLITGVLTSVRLLLNSKSDTDVIETVRLIIRLYKLKLPQAKNFLPYVRLLVFSREKKIKDQILNTFTQLHLSKGSEETALELTHLFCTASPADRSALEEIIEIIVDESLTKGVVVIKPQVYAFLWNSFIKHLRQERDSPQKRAILTILRVAIRKDHSLLRAEQIQSFLNVLRSFVEGSVVPDFYLMRQILLITELNLPILQPLKRNFTLAAIYVLVKTQGTINNQWYSAAEQLLNFIFNTTPHPEKLVELLLRKSYDNHVSKNAKNLCHFLFLLSHCCLKCLICLDSLQNKLKAEKPKTDSMEEEREEELDRVLGGKEAEIQARVQAIQKASETMLHDDFIGKWVKVVESIVASVSSNSELEIIAVLSCCKFMCLSERYCSQMLPKVLAVLERPTTGSVIKNNVVIAMGDLLHRFPNAVEPYNRYLYRTLHDKDQKVRLTTLTVLTHLCLNDMIKAKGELCEIALLFRDSDEEIQAMVRHFFSEIIRKDPKQIFSLIPDALYRFSNPDRYEDQEVFKNFMENLGQYLEKDKYSESLVCKLCDRLSTSLNLLEIKNAAYCLSELSLNEKGLRRVLEYFEQFRKTLETPEVAASMKTLIVKLKKAQKPEMKSLVDEFEAKVDHFGVETFNSEDVKRRNLDKNSKKMKKRGAAAAKPVKPKAASKDMDEEDQVEAPVVVQTRQTRGRQRMAVIEESDDDQDVEDQDYDDDQ